MGHARFSYRVRVSATAERALLAEWGHCRWVWNECVAESRRAHREKRECGPAGLDKMLTGWRAEHAWLRAGSSVAQKQAIRDFGRSRAKALKDIKGGLPVRQRAGMPKFRKRDQSLPTLNYTKPGFTLRHGVLTVAGGIVLRPYPETGKAIGIDWGVTDIAVTTSDAHDLPHPQYGKKSADKLTKYQRQMARRKPKKGSKPSAGYQRAKRKAAKAHAKVAAQRQDTARKWAKREPTIPAVPRRNGNPHPSGWGAVKYKG